MLQRSTGTSLNDYQREEKADEIIQELHDKNTFTVEMTQALIDKKASIPFIPPISGVHLCMLSLKRGMFHKVKICYFITRNKDTIDGPYLEKIYEELRKQAIGENIFHSSEFKQG